MRRLCNCNLCIVCLCLVDTGIDSNRVTAFGQTPKLATFINRAIEVTAGSANHVTHAVREAGKTPFGISASLLYLCDVVYSRESKSTQFIRAVKTIFSPFFTDFRSDFV